MLTKNAVGNLINRYKAVLDTCRLMNTFGTMALVGMMALGGTIGNAHNAWAADIDAEQVINTDTTITTTINVTDTGFYNAQNNNITVSTNGAVTVAKGTTIGGTISPAGGLWANSLEISGGTYETTKYTNIYGELEVSGGTYTATGNTNVNGTLTISGGTYTATGKTDVNGTLTISGGIYNVGSDDAAWVNTAVTNAGLTANEDTAILAIAKANSLTINTATTALNVASPLTSSGAYFGANSLFVIDGSQFTGGTYALDSPCNIDVTAGAKLLIASSAVDFVAGVATVKVARSTENCTLTIADGAWGYDSEGATTSDPDIVDPDTIFTDSKLIDITGVSFDADANTYTVSLSRNSVVAGYEDGASLDKDLAAQIDALDTKDAAYKFFANTNAKGAHGATTMSVNGGTLPSMGLVGSSATANVQAHNSLTVAESPTGTYLAMNGDGIVLPSTSREMTKGFGIWAMPMYKHTNANDFATGNQEYGFDANIYGMTLGADYTFDSNLRLGAAMHVGMGTVENSGDLPDTENNFDYFGLTAYAAKHFDKLALSADLGFTASSNDIEQAGGLKADSDAMLFTAGIKAEYLFDFKSFELTPYIGARINHYELDDFDTKLHGARQVRNYDADATIVEFPMGLAIATDLQSGDWTLTPSASLGVKFAAGDLEADQEYSLGNSAHKAIMTSEVADAVTFQGTLGLGMKKDVYSIDLGYTLDMSEHVQSHGVQVDLRYEFWD